MVKYLTYLPDSKAGDAIGESSTLTNSWPSVGLFGFGWTTSQDTWAKTLSKTNICACFIVVLNNQNSEGTN